MSGNNIAVKKICVTLLLQIMFG